MKFLIVLKQFLYLKNYDWIEKYCKIILNDIKEVGKKNRKDFVDIIV